jgi:hypothetical protein
MKIDIKDIRNLTAFGDPISEAEASDFFFLLDNVRNAEALLSEAVRLLGVCKNVPNEGKGAMPADLFKMEQEHKARHVGQR